MDKRRKISVRKVLRTFVTIVTTTCCIVAVLGASQIQETKSLEKITLHIRNSQYRFLEKETLLHELTNKARIKEGQTRLAVLNVRGVEQSALDNPWVSEAEAYIDNKREMHVFVTQRIPVARLFYDNLSSYYIDSSANLLPLSGNYTFYTPVVTNIPVLANPKEGEQLRKDIIKLVRFVEKDSFWSAQIAQISITPDLNFELVPVLGLHKITFGDLTNMEEKFQNLFAFYKKVLNRVGWDRYTLLDLRFEGQIIASPAVPWEPSIKNPISNMDWVKSIIASGPAEASPVVKAIAAAKEGTARKEKKANAKKPKPVVGSPSEEDNRNN